MKKESRYIQLQTILVLLLFFGLLYWFLHKPYLLGIAGGLLVIGIFFPAVVWLIHTGWMKLSHVLGLISGSIILGVVFFVVVTPMGLFYRKFRKPGFPVLPGSKSSFTDRNHLFVKEDMENMW